MDDLTAWQTHPEWREDFVSNATRELSKTGDLVCHEHIFRALASGLTSAEVVWLYRQLQQSRRPEFEWRDSFLALFPQVKSTDLPPSLAWEGEVLGAPDDIPI